jgi:hypothetical protein
MSGSSAKGVSGMLAAADDADGARLAAGALDSGAADDRAVEALGAGSLEGTGAGLLVGARSATDSRGAAVVCCGGELGLRVAASSRAFALACAAAASLSRAIAITGGDDVARPALRAGAAEVERGFWP